jgi:hypothetical protein
MVHHASPQALEAYDLRLFEAGRFGRPVAEGTDELLDQAVKSLDRRAMQVACGRLSSAMAVPILIVQPLCPFLIVKVTRPKCMTLSLSGSSRERGANMLS